MTSKSPVAGQSLLSRREAAAGLLMLGVAGAAALRMPNIPINKLGSSKLEDIVPARIGEWDFVQQSGLVLPPEDQLSQTLYSQLLTRVYSDGATPPVMLLIAYSANQTGFLQVHRPEICYAAGGYAIGPVQSERVQLPGGASLTANLMPATLNGSTETVLYWTRIGSRVPGSWAQQRLAIVEDNLRRIIPDAALIRMSTIVQDPAVARASLNNFASEMISSLAPSGRRVFTA